VTDGETHAAIDAVIRIESARLIAGLAHYTGAVGLAEELALDAVVAALEPWPGSGVPRNPGAWLMTVAKRRAIDLFRRNERLRDRYGEIGRGLATDAAAVDPDFDRAVSDDIDDDLLRLVFTACHPVLSMPARVALTLRLLGLPWASRRRATGPRSWTACVPSWVRPAPRPGGCGRPWTIPRSCSSSTRTRR
jgi:predicted RNA polymerase sigma factor